VILKNGSHFLVEDLHDEYAAALLGFLREIG
jgi:hypothetical protein